LIDVSYHYVGSWA